MQQKKIQKRQELLLAVYGVLGTNLRPVCSHHPTIFCNCGFNFLLPLLIFFCPPLHIKLGLFKQFVKALNKDSPVFSFLQSTFPSLSNAKIKEGVFIGPQIRKLFRNDELDKMLNADKCTAWNCFKDVCQNFLDSHRADNYVELVTKLLHSYEVLGYKMSLKVHFLASFIKMSFIKT